jgi:hypothetical protein
MISPKPHKVPKCKGHKASLVSFGKVLHRVRRADELRPIDMLLITGLARTVEGVQVKRLMEPVVSRNQADVTDGIRQENAALRRWLATFQAVAVTMLFALFTGCSTPAAVVQPSIKKPSPVSAMMPSALIRSASVVSGCPTTYRTNNLIYVYTNCVLEWVMQLNTNWTNPNYGQFAFTGYVTTNNAISVETGTAQPADWIGPMWSPIKVWTFQYKYNYRDAWSDGISDTNSQTYVQFSEADATQPSVFYRIKYQ